MTFATTQSRWRALTTRDATADGHFVYSVKSTGIYCKPGCSARLARRANVGFYDTAAEAEQAGFRACKRCKPESGNRDDPQERAVEKACVLIAEAKKNGNTGAIRLQDLATHVGLTPRYFHKIFKDKTGVTPKEYARLNGKESTNIVGIIEDATFVLGAGDNVEVNDDFLLHLPALEFNPSLTNYENSVDTPTDAIPLPPIRYLGESVSIPSRDDTIAADDSRGKLHLESHCNEVTRLALEADCSTQPRDQEWPVTIQFEPIPSLSDFSLDFSSTPLLSDDPFVGL